MPPIPCAHCGNNFMRRDLNPDTLKLCNNCSIREKLRTKQGEKKMPEISITIKCPQETYQKIEESCLNEGIDISKYFLQLHAGKNLISENDSKQEYTEEKEVEKSPAIALSRGRKKYG